MADAFSIRRALKAAFPDATSLRVRRVNDTTNVQIVIDKKLRHVQVTSFSYPLADAMVAAVRLYDR